MKLTRRGRIVGGAVVFLFVWAATFGLQAMNAVVLSSAVAYAASWLLVRRVEQPRVRREPVPPAFAGAGRDVAVRVALPPSLSATLVDDLPEAVEPAAESDEVPISRRWARYEVVPDRRGVHVVGPATVRVRDPFGLLEAEHETTGTTTLLTYPPVRELRGVDERPDLLPHGAPTRDRHEFDRLREYDRSMSVRDIDWKSSAKRSADPLIVKEFVSESETGNALIIGESEPGGTDAMASAAASISVRLLDAGVSVGLETRDESIPVVGGGTQQTVILSALARTSGGRVERESTHAGAIRVIGDEHGHVTVRSGAREVPFETLAGQVVERAGGDDELDDADTDRFDPEAEPAERDAERGSRSRAETPIASDGGRSS